MKQIAEQKNTNSESCNASSLSLTILVADDDDAIRRMLRILLESEGGYNVIESEDGPGTLKEMQENKKIDVVLLDILMPRMNGLEIVKAVQKQRLSIAKRVIIMTAYSNMENNVLQLGVAGFLVKPFVYIDFVLYEVQRVLRESGREK